MQALRVLCCAACLLQHVGAAQAEVFPSLRRHGHPHRASAPSAPADTSVPTTPVEVPAALPATLPAVSQVLGGASESLKSITSQVSSLEVLEPTRMAKAKAVFERKLKLQEDANRQVVQANALIEANISSLKSANEELRKKAKSLEQGNALMREELSATESRLGAVKQYIGSTLKVSDDSEAPELEVLGGAHKKAPKQPHKKPQPHVFTEVSHDVQGAETKPQQPPAAKSGADADSDDDDDDDDDDQDPGLSFMALSSKRVMVSSAASAESSEALAAQQALAEMDATATLDSTSTDSASVPQPDPSAAPTAAAPQQPAPPAAEASAIDVAAAADTPVAAPVEVDPQQVLAALAKRVSELTKQQKSEEAKYSELYKRDAKAGEKRHKALLLQQRQLTATRDALTVTHSRLNDACLHLEATQKELAARLRGLGLFAQRVSHLLLAPEGEAAPLLAALPKKVTPAVASRPAP